MRQGKKASFMPGPRSADPQKDTLVATYRGRTYDHLHPKQVCYLFSEEREKLIRTYWESWRLKGRWVTHHYTNVAPTDGMTPRRKMQYLIVFWTLAGSQGCAPLVTRYLHPHLRPPRLLNPENGPSVVM